MDLLIGILIAIWLVTFYLGVRNEVAFWITRRALDMASALARHAMAQDDPDWDRYYHTYSKKSYNQIVFSFCWTVKKAYPELYQEYEALLENTKAEDKGKWDTQGMS